MTASAAFRSASATAACSRNSGCMARALETSSSRVGTVMVSIAVLILTRSDRASVIAQSAFRDVHHAAQGLGRARLSAGNGRLPALEPVGFRPFLVCGHQLIHRCA